MLELLNKPNLCLFRFIRKKKKNKYAFTLLIHIISCFHFLLRQKSLHLYSFITCHFFLYSSFQKLPPSIYLIFCFSFIIKRKKCVLLLFQKKEWHSGQNRQFLHSQHHIIIIIIIQAKSLWENKKEINP